VVKVEFFQGANKLGEDSTGPYGFTWTGVPAGRYVLTARATDNRGGVSDSEPVEVFVNTTGGSLSGSITRPPTLPALVNLTTEGTADWIHWGARTNGGFDRKAGVAQQLDDFTLLGGEPPQRFGDNYTGFSWSDGTPTTRATNTPTGLYVPGLGNGFLLAVPADATTRTLKVYVGAYAAHGRFQAWLSDFSARAYADVSVSNFFDNAYAVYTLTYDAASPGQTLLVRYTAKEVFDPDFGNVTLQTATLVGGGGTVQPRPVALFAPRWLGNGFAFSFLSQAGASYSVQYTPSLAFPNWQSLSTLTGDGATLEVTNKNLSAAARFYRVESR
jgi:hypothetical protein